MNSVHHAPYLFVSMQSKTLASLRRSGFADVSFTNAYRNDVNGIICGNDDVGCGNIAWYILKCNGVFIRCVLEMESSSLEVPVFRDHTPPGREVVQGRKVYDQGREPGTGSSVCPKCEAQLGKPLPRA